MIIKKVLNSINNINEFIDDTNDHLVIPIDCLLKFDMVVVSCRLATEKK